MPPKLEILVRYLKQAFPAKAVFVPPVHNTNRQSPEPVHRIDILIYVGPGEVCKKWTVIDGVTGKKHPCSFFPKARYCPASDRANAGSRTHDRRDRLRPPLKPTTYRVPAERYVCRYRSRRAGGHLSTRRNLLRIPSAFSSLLSDSLKSPTRRTISARPSDMIAASLS